MRNTFIKVLVELAENDSRILLLTGDLGYTVIEPFAERFPSRFLNVGVAEQNMVGIATGLSASGFIPFIYSIATFASLRPYEIIRNGPILHNLPVRIVGVGGGFEYGHAGITHHALEDLGVMRINPGITVISPADYEQTRSALLSTWDLPGPIYYRIGKDEENIIPGLLGRFELKRAQFVREGSDVLIISLGSITREAVLASEVLADKEGIGASVMVVACLNPAPVEDLVEALSSYKRVLTVETHYTVGGLGSMVSEIVAERNLDCKVIRCGVKVRPDGITGSQDYLQKIHNISKESIIKTCLRELAGSKPT